MDEIAAYLYADWKEATERGKLMKQRGLLGACICVGDRGCI